MKIMLICGALMIAATTGAIAQDSQPSDGPYVGLNVGLVDYLATDSSETELSLAVGYRVSRDNLIVDISANWANLSGMGPASELITIPEISFARELKQSYGAELSVGYLVNDAKKLMLFAGVGHNTVKYDLVMTDLNGPGSMTSQNDSSIIFFGGAAYKISNNLGWVTKVKGEKHFARTSRGVSTGLKLAF